MSNTINPLSTAVLPPPSTDLSGTEIVRKPPLATDLKTAVGRPEKAFHGRSIFKALDKLSDKLEHGEKKDLKNIDHLARSLEKMFGEAPKVDHETGEEESKKGGLRRVAKDLGKLFKGLGMPPQLAKQFSRGITQALRDEDVEQIDFSMTATRSFNLELQQTQQGYLASGDGTGVAASVNNSFQVSAVQVRSLDFSLNLRTGEFSYSRTQVDSFSFSSSTTVGLANSAPSEQSLPATAAAAGEPVSTTEQPPSSPVLVEETVEPVHQRADTEAALNRVIQGDSQLLQISRTIQQSAIMQLKPVVGAEEAEEAEEELQLTSFDLLKSLIDKMEELAGENRNLFEPHVQVNNLRVEKEADDEDDLLRFTLDALVPVGLTVIDQSGHGSTLYPRNDGSLGKTVEDGISGTA